MKQKDLALSLPLRLILLLCFFLAGYAITAVATFVVSKLCSDNMPAALRISAVIQDLFAFIIPSIAAALMITRRPADFLCLRKKPGIFALIAVAIILIISIPAQEIIIDWNNNIKLPESMAAFGEMARALENQAAETMKLMMSDTSIGALIVNILIVGVFAGLSEELLFRGCFQRILTTGGVNVHVAIWSVAFCFSALHMQFFGFVPRMLLGAYFGYLLLWTGSVWVPATAHIINNVVYVATAWWQARVYGVDAISDEPSNWPIYVVVLSVIFTAAALYIFRKREYRR